MFSFDIVGKNASDQMCYCVTFKSPTVTGAAKSMATTKKQNKTPK